MELMDAYYQAQRKAIAEEKYYAQEAYTIAEDWTDGMLKGKYFLEAAPALRDAFEKSMDRALTAGQVETFEAWLDAITVLDGVIERAKEFVANQKS